MKIFKGVIIVVLSISISLTGCASRIYSIVPSQLKNFKDARVLKAILKNGTEVFFNTAGGGGKIISDSSDVRITGYAESDSSTILLSQHEVAQLQIHVHGGSEGMGLLGFACFFTGLLIVGIAAAGPIN